MQHECLCHEKNSVHFILFPVSPRLIQYPAAPSKGRISVSSEDLQCLTQGEFLNDVIIDFYLKYLLLEGVGGAVAERSHVFSSFFYKQLSKRRAAGEDVSVPHQRVKTWTRNIDIFNKDFLFIPVNQEAHWFLVLVCFPGLEEPKLVEFSPSSGSSLCSYLHVEWESRRGSKRLFSTETFKTCNCRVPQQDNSSDCGLYLLQYAQAFLQNPVVDLELPVRLDAWFPRQHVRDKREEIRRLVLRLHREQTS
uniref:Ubiquitin-like protease family profile domain-containing protein n=1 Tax=Neogobius melanostomus TaxID=47308 RepID=A0A8C6SMI2_9GOBI